MKASYAWLQTYIKEPLPKPDDLAALLTEHVFEVEEVEQVGDDTVFDFKVLPDRAHYLLSHRGLAREIAVIANLTFQEPERTWTGEAQGNEHAISIEQKEFCRRIISRGFEGVNAGVSPQWLKTRLETVGQRSINLMVDISNFVMFDIGQPSHILDADKVVGEIVIRNAHEGEKIEILGGKMVTLKTSDVVFADDNGPLEVAGVKGGARAAVIDGTKNIIVHAGNYAPTSIRRTATRLDLRSDASKRFENEITPELAADGMALLTTLIMQECGQATAGKVVDTYPLPPEKFEIVTTASAMSAMLGTTVTPEEIAHIFMKMECVVECEGDSVRIVPPTERFDLRIPEDIADEIGRLKGYNALPGVLPPALEVPQSQDPLFYYGEKVKNVLVARGYSEVLLYAFGSTGAHEIAYPLAEDKAWLREDLSTRMAEKLVFNKRNADLLGVDAIKLGEVGQVFTEAGERSAFALGVAFTRKKKGESPVDMIKEDLHALSEALGIEVPDTTNTGDYGAICEVDFTALLEKLPAPGALTDLAFTQLPEGSVYKKITPYPFITRDIAVFVSEGITSDEVHALITDKAGELRVTSRLFDEFVKETPEGIRHSYAFRIVFQSPERTLEDKEVNEIMTEIEAAIAGKGWEVR